MEKIICPICDMHVDLMVGIVASIVTGLPVIEVALVCTNPECEYEAFTYLHQSGMSELEVGQ